MVKKSKSKEHFNIKDKKVIKCVEGLDNLIRAEYNTSKNFLDYYAGKDRIGKVNSIKNQVIYGRRGTGKTHLLRALQESLLENDNYFPVYVDVRSFKPFLSDENPLYFALIVFREIIVEMLKTAYANIDKLYKINALDMAMQPLINQKQAIIQTYLNKFNATFNGKYFERIGNVDFDTSEMKMLAASLQISCSPEFTGKGQISQEVKSTNEKIKYISFTEMTEMMTNLINDIEVDRIFFLIDEWSEIPLQNQFILAELIKRAFITLKITVKIAAIPNRTKLVSENRIGLEDGGDIFGYSLDNRYIYELAPDVTKVFFNELLYNQLSLIDPELFTPFYDNNKSNPSHTFLNLFLANQALREILIASAGIPRDFLNLFIGAYTHFLSRNTNNKHLALVDIRSSTISWYEVDKKKSVDVNHNAKVLLDKIIQDILINKKRCHFLIPEKYENNIELNDLIDLRVIHLRKKGISHKGKKGNSYNVYYLDYACYTSSNLYHNRINTKLLNEIETIEDFREIRRISLEDKFFDDFNSEIGNSFKCPHCGNMINTYHQAYIKQNICNHCFEKVD